MPQSEKRGNISINNSFRIIQLAERPNLLPTQREQLTVMLAPSTSCPAPSRKSLPHNTAISRSMHRRKDSLPERRPHKPRRESGQFGSPISQHLDSQRGTVRAPSLIRASSLIDPYNPSMGADRFEMGRNAVGGRRTAGHL